MGKEMIQLDHFSIGPDYREGNLRLASTEFQNSKALDYAEVGPRSSPWAVFILDK